MLVVMIDIVMNFSGRFLFSSFSRSCGPRDTLLVDCTTEVALDKGQLPAVKTLGVLDEFTFQINKAATSAETKQSFFKKIVTLFKPLGFLAPYVVRAKSYKSCGQVGQTGPSL